MTDTPTLDLEKLAELRESGLVLTTGHHDLTDNEFATGCAMDLIGWQVTGDSTDMPECVHPTLARHVHRINDGDDSTSEDRWRIVMEAGPLLVGTAEWSSVKCCLVLARAGLTAGGLIDALRQVANLNGANLNRANLNGANLNRANLNGARGDAFTRLPAGWKVNESGLIVKVEA